MPPPGVWKQRGWGSPNDPSGVFPAPGFRFRQAAPLEVCGADWDGYIGKVDQ